MQKEFKAFKNIVEQAQTFVLTTHINPDGDGLGSQLALHSYLTTIGKKASVLIPNPLPPSYKFLDEQDVVRQFDPSFHTDLVTKADVIVVLDTNHSNRLAGLQEPVVRSRAKKVIIDHHLDSEEFADLYLIDDASAATGEILYRVLVFLGGPKLTRQIAKNLYVAIMTDTGSFRFPKTDPELHRIIAHLIECGADPVSLYQSVYEQGSANRLRLLGTVLARMETTSDGTVAYMVVTREMFVSTGTDETDTENFITYTLGIKGVLIGLLFTELNDCIKVSFRSRGEIRINELAKELGGNGHKNAAGARIKNAALPEVIEKVLQSSRKYVTT